MSSLKLKHSGGNGVIIAAPSSNPAADRTLTLPGDADGTILTSNSATGKILQVLSTPKTDTFSRTDGDTWGDITGLSQAITAASANNKILVIADVKIGHSGNPDLHIKIIRDSTDIYIGAAASNRQQTSFGTQTIGHNFTSQRMEQVHLTFLDTAPDTSSHTYKVQIRNNKGGTVYINRTHNDTDNDEYPRTASSITVMEVAA
tara:strand:+ start:120 stop:728 length:609 start_codon:yes stop_codon:yes gene_type:complete